MNASRFLFVLVLLVSGTVAPAADVTAEPLVKVIGEVSMKDNPSAKDFARIAGTTLDFARRKLQSRESPAQSVIESALDAVDAGEARDANAADWPKLRVELNDLLEKKPDDPPSKKDKPQPQKDKRDEDKNGQENEPQEGEKSDSKDRQDSQDRKQKDKEGKKDDPQSSENKSDESQDSGSEEKPQPPADKKNASAFGDMKEQPSAPPPEAAQPNEAETQKVGGQPKKEDAATAAEPNPRLAIPLQKLEHLRQQDSPAKLFRMMDGEGSRTPATKKGKDW